MGVRFRLPSAFLIGGLLLSQVPAIQADQPPSVSPSSQGSPIAEQLLGTWRLVAVTNDEGGRVIPSPDYGSHPAGYLMYDATGHVCVQLMSTTRPKWKDEDFPTPDEARSAPGVARSIPAQTSRRVAAWGGHPGLKTAAERGAR